MEQRRQGRASFVPDLMTNAAELRHFVPELHSGLNGDHTRFCAVHVSSPSARRTIVPSTMEVPFSAAAWFEMTPNVTPTAHPELSSEAMLGQIRTTESGNLTE
eukprot:946911-Rhodomonas_salina.1